MIRDDIQKAIFTNLKEGKAMEVKVLRFILSEIKYAEIAKQKDLTDEEAVAVLQKEVKKRKEAIEMFKKGERFDLVTDEEAQLVIIAQYLPKQLPVEELNKIIDSMIAEIGDKSNMGKIIGAVMGRVKRQADGSQVAQLVKQKLN
jgi:hypothetical protein